MEALPPLNAEMILVMIVMLVAIGLFISDVFRVDVTALLIMTFLGLASALPWFDHLPGRDILFAGLASSAVVSIIAIMIMGRGLDKAGVMDQIAWSILRYGGRTETRVIAASSTVVAGLSSFMQNIGAAALFIPVISRISDKTGLSLSRLLMPMGFCAILGGTMTMVASSPLIMLNDLIESTNESLSPDGHIATFDLFDVTPVGLALVACGLVYFLTLGRSLLPAHQKDTVVRGAGTVRYMRKLHGVDAAVREVQVPADSPLVGRDIRSLQNEFEVRVVATKYPDKVLVSPRVSVEIAAPASLAVIAQPQNLRRFVTAGKLRLLPKLKEFRYLLARSIAGIAELVIPPESGLIGHSVRELNIRRVYGISLLSIVRQGKPILSHFYDVPFEAGDTLVVHTAWSDLALLENNRNFVVVTSNYPREPHYPHKIVLALAFFAIAIGLVIFSNLYLPVALMVGAIGMIVSGVLTIDEAYGSVSWQTVFLLAGLLPLGHAVATTGVADYIAQFLVLLAGEPPAWVLQIIMALLATAFTLVMSNVGATVILVPVAISTAIACGADPAVFALTVALAASNSFILPTHPVNALVMGPGSYRVRDFIRVGGLMTLLFLLVEITVLNLMF